MPPPWRRIVIERYGPTGHEGSWVAEKDSAEPWTEADRVTLVKSASNWIRETSVVRYVEDGQDLFIAVFNGIAPPPGSPKSGTLYEPPSN